VQSFAEWLAQRSAPGYTPLSTPQYEPPQYGSPEIPTQEEEQPEETKKRPSFSEWMAQKAGKAPISGFGGVPATPLATPPEKTPPWGSLARGPRVPGTLQTPLSPKAQIAGLGAPGEMMPSTQQYALMPPEEQAAWKQWEKETMAPGELVPEVETLPPSAQRAFQRRLEGVEYYLKTGKPLVRTEGKMGLARLPDIWKQTEKGGVEYMPTIAEKISDKIATGQDLSKIESLGNRALLLASGIVNGYTGGIFSEAYKDEMIPQDVVDELLYQGGHFAGWIKGWPKIAGEIFAGKIAKPAIDALSKVVKAAPKTQAWLQYLGGATRLGAMSAASDLNLQPEETLKAGLEGTALGAIFQGTALLDFFKSPVINQMVRNVGSRAMANIIGAYDPKIITALKDDPAQAIPAIVDEIFMSWFSAPGKKPGLMMKQWSQAQTEIAKFNQTYKTQIKTSPEIGRIVRNLSTMQEMALRPGTEKGQAALAQQNQELMQMYRDRHAMVSITAGRTFIAGPGGKIIPPGEPEARIRMRQRAEELHEQRRQAEQTAEFERKQEIERQARLPVHVPGESEREPRFHMGMHGEVPKEIALEPEGKRMKRQFIAERQFAAQQERIERGIVEKMKPAPTPPPVEVEKPKPLKKIDYRWTPPEEITPKMMAEQKVIRAQAAEKMISEYSRPPLPAKPITKPPVAAKPAALPTVPKEKLARGEEALRKMGLAAPEVPAKLAAKPIVTPKPAKPGVKPAEPVVEKKEPGVFGRHVPPGEYKLHGNFLYRGNRAVFDLNVMAKDLVYRLRDAKRQVTTGEITLEQYAKRKTQIITEASREYESYKPWKTQLKPAEAYKAKEARVALERKIVAKAIASGRKKPEVLEPWTEAAEKSELAKNLEEHRDFKDSQFKRILEIMLPEEKQKIGKLGIGSKKRWGKPGKVPRIGLSVEYREKAESWFDEADLKEIEKVTGKGPGPEVEFMKAEGGTSHAGQAGFSQEALSRPQRFVMYDTRTKRYRPLGKLEGIDQTPASHEVKFAINNRTNKVAWADKGSGVSMPVPALVRNAEVDIPRLGLSLQRVTPRSLEDLELDRALAERRIPGTGIRIPRGEKIDSASDFVIRSETKTPTEGEKHWVPGFTVLGNLRRMGPEGKVIAKAGDKFVFEQNADTSRDQWLAKGAQKMVAHSMKKSGELKDVPFLKRSETIGKRIVDLVENKVQPANEHEKAAQGIVKEIFKDMAQQAEILGLKIKTAFGREVPWAERKDYFPQVWKKGGLDKFLNSEDTPFRHLRDIYIEHLAKELNPDLFKSDSKEAVRQMEMRWREIRHDLKSRPFANLEMSRILDEEILGKLQAKWAASYPKEKFPLERDYGLHVLNNYISGGRARLAWVRNFGKDVRTEKGDFAPELVYETIPKMKSQANYNYTLDFFRQYLTRSGFDTKSTKLMRDIRTAQLVKLGTAFIPNATQWFTNVLPLVSTKAALQGLMDSMKAIRDTSKMKEYFMKSGARTMKSALREALMEDRSKINGFADMVLKVHLFSGTEYWNALYAAMTGGRKAIEVSGKLAARPEAYRAKAWEDELRKLGVEDADIAQIKGGKPIEMGSSQYLRAMFEMRKNTQFLSDAFHLPKAWSNPLGRLATQFKNFAYNQTRLILTEPVAEAWKFAKTNGREGSVSKLMKAMIILPAAGAAITKAREETYKVFGIHFYEELMAGKSWPVKYLIFLANAGSLGIATDILGAIGYGTKGMAQIIGGPSASDLMSFTEALGNTWGEVKTAVANKSPGWISHRGTAIREYWLRPLERVSPDMRIIIQNFFKNWKDAKEATNWSAVYKEATKTYKEAYKLKGEYEANQFWEAWMATQGQEYTDIFGKTPRKPTAKEIEQWWEEMGKPTVERMNMPGTSGEGGTGGTYLW